MFMDISYRIRITVLKTNEMNCLYTLEFFNNFELSSVQFHFCFFFLSLSLTLFATPMRNTRDEKGGGYFFFLVLDLSLTKEAFFSSNSIETRIAIPRGTMRACSQQCRISLCGRVLLN